MNPHAASVVVTVLVVAVCSLAMTWLVMLALNRWWGKRGAVIVFTLMFFGSLVTQLLMLAVPLWLVGELAWRVGP